MKKKLYIASGNAHKISEIKSLLNDFNFEVLGIQDLKGFTAPKETGTTFQENALLKAKTLQDFLKTQNQEPAYILADDSGVQCEDLDGKPGIYSARFAGENASDHDNNQKLISELKKLSNPTLNMQYVCALIFLTPAKSYAIEESCNVKVIFEPRGKNGFGYDPYAFLPKLQKTMAELTSQEKNQISHRGKAMRKLITILNGFKF